jgi:hypothetical protein
MLDARSPGILQNGGFHFISSRSFLVNSIDNAVWLYRLDGVGGSKNVIAVLQMSPPKEGIFLSDCLNRSVPWAARVPAGIPFGVNNESRIHVFSATYEEFKSNRRCSLWIVIRGCAHQRFIETAQGKDYREVGSEEWLFRMHASWGCLRALTPGL